MSRRLTVGGRARKGPGRARATGGPPLSSHSRGSSAAFARWLLPCTHKQTHAYQQARAAMHSLRQHPCSHRAASCSAHRLVPPPPCLNARPLAPPATPLTAQSPCQGPEPHQPRSLTCDASKGFGSALDPKKAVGQTCPCGSKQFYRECCEQYHTGKASAPTAEGTSCSGNAAYKTQHSVQKKKE